ncbi:MAG TPA: SH3 domain-containing protein [Chloroflexota bacterium]|nr:SH3 domain-containing protein [Chloroflexota bacterium]
MSGLYYDTYLPVVGQALDSAGTVWYRVTLWGVLDGWIRADQTEIGDPPAAVPSASEPSPVAESGTSDGRRNDSYPLLAKGLTRDQYLLRSSANVDADIVGLVEPGVSLDVRAFAADGDGSVWYLVSDGTQDGWIWGGGLDLAVSDPTSATVNGVPIANSASGKGMWLPLPLLDLAEPAAIVSAAKSLGLTNVYMEAGSSEGGFYGRKGADRFLAAAHAADLKVIAWMMTRLDSVPGDIQLCASIATYRTPSGDKFDGIAPDVEYNMAAADVRTFSEVLRTELGPERLIVGVIYPAGSWIGQRYPVAGILSRSFNVIAPMAYWHDSQDNFSANDVNQFISKSVADVRVAVGSSTFPVAIIAQGYDNFGRNGIGLSSPSGAEASAALVAAHNSGAIGVSFFQWGTMTPDEWTALKVLSWAHGV